MRSILAAIARFLRAMPRFVFERVQVAGEWISRLVAVPAPYEPEALEQQKTEMADDDAAHVAALRTAASHLASGLVPPDDVMNRLRERDIEWLAALSTPMMCKVAVASDVALEAHIRRLRPIRGVLAVNPAAVADYRRAAAMERQRALEERQAALAPA